MGRRIFLHQCPVCNYYVESELYIGWSGISPIFLRNHYELAVCHDCHNLISVIVPNTPEQQAITLTEARRNLVITEAEALAGDPAARLILPDLRESLDIFDSQTEEELIGECELCGSHHFTAFSDLNLDLLEARRIWLDCPRCTEGRLLIEPVGEWV